MSSLPPAAVVTGCVALPGPARLGGVAVGCHMVEPEGVSDDGRRGLKDKLAQSRDPGGLGRNSELTYERPERRWVERLAGTPAGEQPPAGRVGGTVHVLAVPGEADQELGERLRDR